MIVYDNLSTGKRDFINQDKSKEDFSFVLRDLLDFNALSQAMKGVDFVYHIAANSDIRPGPINSARPSPRISVSQKPVDTIGTSDGVCDNGQHYDYEMPKVFFEQLELLASFTRLLSTF